MNTVETAEFDVTATEVNMVVVSYNVVSPSTEVVEDRHCPVALELNWAQTVVTAELVRVGMLVTTDPTEVETI